jgi:hypothetical protein
VLEVYLYVCVCCSVVRAVCSAHSVRHDVPITGYVTVDEAHGRKLFYWFVEVCVCGMYWW